MKKYIDIETWPRKQHFLFFKEMDYPHFNITANVDITTTFSYVKENNLSLFKTLVYLTTKAANNVTEFRYRLDNDKVVEYEMIHPSFTYLTQQEVFSFCTVDYLDDFKQFLIGVNNKIAELTGSVDMEDDPARNDRIFITSIPWVSFTSITHPFNLDSSDSVPRIGWGKYFNENDKIKLPLSVQAHHALMDGLHVGKYFNHLQEMLDHPEESIN